MLCIHIAYRKLLVRDIRYPGCDNLHMLMSHSTLLLVPFPKDDIIDLIADFVKTNLHIFFMV